MNITIHRKFQTRRIAEDSTRLYGAGFPKSLFKILGNRIFPYACVEN